MPGPSKLEKVVDPDFDGPGVRYLITCLLFT